MRGRDGRELRVVVGGSDLHDVRAYELHAGQCPDHREQLAAGQPARLRGAGAGRMSRVEHVDVDGEVHGTIADAREHPVDRPAEPLGLQLHARDDREAEALVVAEVLARVQRPPDADVEARLEVDEPLLGGASEGAWVIGAQKWILR